MKIILINCMTFKPFSSFIIMIPDSLGNCPSEKLLVEMVILPSSMLVCMGDPSLPVKMPGCLSCYTVLVSLTRQFYTWMKGTFKSSHGQVPSAEEYK